MLRGMLSSLLLAICLAAAPSLVHAQSTSSVSPAEVEARVRSFFADTPVMVAIASCESEFRQYTDAGSVLRGGLGNGMVGVFQIYERIHTRRAATLGHNLSTLEGNLGYAQYLYERQGTKPWRSSRSCWKDVAVTAADSTGAEDITRAKLRKRILALKEQLALLQRLLELQQLS